MTDSMNFGPDWIRNLSSEGSTGGGTAGGVKYQLAEYRYGREEMLALFDKNTKPPISLTNFKYLYSEQTLVPLALLPTADEEQRPWPTRPSTLSSHPGRGRGGSLERGGRITRGRGYQGYGRSYDVDPADWSPRKEYSARTPSMDNWRRSRSGDPEEDGWRSVSATGGRSGTHEKWARSTSWRGEGELEDKSAPPERNSRSGWGDINRGPPGRKSWDNEDHLPEWANENPTEGGGSFDDKGAFHGSDEDLDIKPLKREVGLQKSTSQQHISTKIQPPPLSISKSTMSLVKPEDSSKKKEDQVKEPEKEVQEVNKEENSSALERMKSVPNIPEKIDKPTEPEKVKPEGPPKPLDVKLEMPNGPIPDRLKNEDSDFERLQEDLVLKLMGDEELPKQAPSGFEVGSIQPPPNLIPPVIQDKWFYQDPQGQMQGPFSNIEMAEWYKAGYFSNQLKVRRQCDERFFLLGELITLCGGVNPFTSGIRFPVLKNDVTKLPDTDLLQLTYLSQMAAYKQAQARILQEPWSALTLQQQELAAQRLIMQQQQVPQDLPPFMQQPQTANPLMHMINQMQQANKLPGPGLVEKQPPNMPPALDPHLHLHMGNILSMQNRLPTTNMTNSLPAGLSGNLTGTLPTETLSSTMPNLQSGIPLTTLQPGVPPVNMPLNLPRPTSHGAVEQISGTTQTNDPISSLLKQLQQQKQQTQQSVPPLDSLWQQNQYSIPASNTAPPPHWQSQNGIPMSMWDVTHDNANISSIPTGKITEKQLTTPSETQSQLNLGKTQKVDKDREKDKEKEKEAKLREENEKRRKKELEEKQAKKDAEEKRKAELKKLEVEKKAAEERKKKEEERVRKELERAKKEAEEKRLRELEEKRRLKEQRKAEEEARKRLDDIRRSEEERIKNELKEAEARRQAEEKRLQQEQLRIAKAAPWSQSNSSLGLSLAEIQKAEREKRAHDAALQLQRLQEKEYQQQQQQQQQERVGGIQLNWAKKPIEPRKVKSLAEIQAEEQERLVKQVAEARLQKEKESVPVLNNTSSIWSNQNLTWACASTTNSQWSASTGGFWDDTTTTKQTVNKPSNIIKSNSTNTFNSVPKQQTQTPKQPAIKANKTKKEEATKNTNHNNNNNNPSMDEFTSWCFVSLAKMSTNIDIPTFITFLRDIESAFDVREYCKEYLGDSNTTHQFASSFLEKRRSFKPKNNAHKDDMCSPAPAITPSSLQHSTEFQEVKGKNKKNKKSKMLKVDARILGFNVTSAPDRINVGDRDYGDNS